MADEKIDRAFALRRAAELARKADQVTFNATIQHRATPAVTTAWAELSQAYSALARSMRDGESIEVDV